MHACSTIATTRHFAALDDSFLGPPDWALQHRTPTPQEVTEEHAYKARAAVERGIEIEKQRGGRDVKPTRWARGGLQTLMCLLTSA